MKLNEIFSSTVNLTWKNESDSLSLAEFDIDDKHYECFIEAGTYKFEDKDLSFLNVGFSRIINSEKQFDLTLDTQDSIKVLGAVINGISKKAEEYHADAIMLSAVDNVEKRMRIYQWIARKFSTKYGTWVKSIKVPNGEVTLLISSSLAQSLVTNFINFIKHKNLDK